MEAGSGGKYAGDCQASPGAAVGEMGLGQERSSYCTCTYINLNAFFFRIEFLRIFLQPCVVLS